MLRGVGPVDAVGHDDIPGWVEGHIGALIDPAMAGRQHNVRRDDGSATDEFRISAGVEVGDNAMNPQADCSAPEPPMIFGRLPLHTRRGRTWCSLACARRSAWLGDREERSLARRARTSHHGDEKVPSDRRGVTRALNRMNARVCSASESVRRRRVLRVLGAKFSLGGFLAGAPPENPPTREKEKPGWLRAD